MPDLDPSVRILTALRDGLLAARTPAAVPGPAHAYPLNATTLPAGRDGAPDAVLGVLVSALGDELVVRADEPVLSGQSLILSGRTAVLSGLSDMPVTLTFEVGRDQRLRADWVATPEPGWVLADAFPVLADGPYAALEPVTPLLICTTYDHSDARMTAPLRSGLNVQFTVRVHPQLLPAGQDAATAVVGGPITITADGPRFTLTGDRTLPDLSVARTGQPSLRFVNGKVIVSAEPGAEPRTSVTGPRIAGQLVAGDLRLDAELELPTGYDTVLHLTAAPRAAERASETTGSSPRTVPTAPAALTLLGETEGLGAWLPAALLGLAGGTVSGYELRFDPLGGEPTTATCTMTFGSAEWQLVPALGVALATPILTATVTRASGHGPVPVTSYSASVRGRLRTRMGAYAVEAEPDDDGLWWFTITETERRPGTGVLAALGGLNESQITQLLPVTLSALGELVTPTRAVMAVDPGAPGVAEVWFVLGQTAPWPIANGLLTLSNWEAEVEIAPGSAGWHATGTLTGDITLTLGDVPTTMHVQLRLPAGEGDRWTLALDERTPIQLPTIGQALALLGATPGRLPTALDTLSGLTVTAFAVSVDTLAARVEHLSLMCEQAGDWVIVPDAGLRVTGVRLALAFSPGPPPVCVAGQVSGTVTLAGTPVDALMSKNADDEAWTLRIGWSQPVHVPGLDRLDAWLAKDRVPAALPGGFPLASGLDVRDVVVRFAADGGVRSISGVLTADDIWTVVEGRLSLTDVRAEVTVPYPLSGATVTGRVAGVLTLAGVSVGVVAERPHDGKPWQFSGRLLDGVAIDVVAAANQVAASGGYALPGGAVSRGLPSTITVKQADVLAVPQTGRYRLSGEVGIGWNVTVGGAALTLAALTAEVEVLERGQPPVAAIGASLDYAGIRARLLMRLGGADSPVVLNGAITDASAVRIADAADGIATGGTAWSQAAPPGLPALTFTRDVAVHLDLGRARFLLYGTLSYGSTPTAEALLYCAAPAETGAWSYAVVLSIGSGFRFQDLIPALSVIDDNLKVTEARLIVCDLRGQTLAILAATTNTLLATLDPGRARPLRNLDAEPLALNSGAYLNARIDFGQTSLFSRLLEIGDPTAPPTIRVSALVKRSDPAATTFEADLPLITLGQRVAFAGTGGRAGLRLTYSAAQAHRFTLDGRIRLLDVFGTTYAFDAALTVDGTGMTATIAQTGQSIAAPFGIPGIALSNLKLNVAYTWGATPGARSTRFVLGGELRFGPAPSGNLPDTRPVVHATLALRDGVPVLVHAALAADLPIADFLSQCLTGSGWPTDFTDLRLMTGSRISYYAAQADPQGAFATYEGVTYTDGFTVAATVRVTIVTPTTVTGLITVTRERPEDTGFTSLNAALRLTQPIDLGVLSLAGAAAMPPATGGYTGGPTLALQIGRAPKLALATGVNLLGAPFVSAEVTVRKGTDGGTRLTGTITAGRPVEPFGTPQFGFAYASHPSGQPTFTIENWPRFSWARQLIDFAAKIKEICGQGGSPCGRITEAVQAACDPEFKLTPAATLAGTDLRFTLTGSYTLTMRGAATPFLTATLPPFTVNVPITTSWESLPGAFVVGFAAASADIVKDLLRHADQAALLLAMLFGPQALAVGLKLACDSLVDSAVATAAEAAWTAIAEIGRAHV